MKRPVSALLALAVAVASVGWGEAPRRQDVEVDLVVAATTDVHGWLRGWDYYRDAADTGRGLARAGTIIDSLRAEHPGRVVVVDAGDLLQGNPLAYLAATKLREPTHPVIAAMNAVGYDAAVVGNHEFNYGLPALEHAIERAGFPFLAANAYGVDGARAFPAYRIVERAGLRVAIVGATTPGAMLWDANNLGGKLILRGVVGEVGRAVREAREKGRADLVVTVLHSGLDGTTYDTVVTRVPPENVAARVAERVPGIDLIVFGHTHREVADTTIGSTMLMQPGYWASSVGVAHLVARRQNGVWRLARRTGALVRAAGHAESPRVLAASASAHEATVAYVRTPVGSTPVVWRGDSARVQDTPLLDFVAEVERRATGADLASTAAFSLAARIGPGPITIADLARLYPYDNTLKVVRITGRQLRAYLEHSARYFRSLGEPSLVDTAVAGFNFDMVTGVEYEIDLTRPAGARITRLDLKGRPVSDTATFTLALSNYRQSGGGGYAMLQGAPVILDKQQEVRQLLIDELGRKKTIRPADYFTRNWSLVPTDAAARAYRDTWSRFDSAAMGREAGSGKAPSRLRIIATGDLHGFFEPRRDSAGTLLGGITHVAGAIGRLRAECVAPACVSILLDAGDMFVGTPAAGLLYGRPVVSIYNLLDYSAAAFGNHELDWGADTLRARMREARFRILAANVRRANGSDADWIPDDTLVERGGLRIGVIGIITTSMPTLTRPSFIRDLQFVDPAPIVSERARALRARGADVVIVVGHVGGTCASDGTGCRGEIFRMAEQLTAPVDAIVSGHSHWLVQTVVNGIPIVQARSYGRAVGVIDLALDRSGPPAVRVLAVRPDSTPGVAAIDSIVRQAMTAVGPRLKEPVTELAESMLKGGAQFPLGNLVADAMRAGGKGDIGVMNNGGLRLGLPAGWATYESVFELHPFGNMLDRLTVRGSSLRAYFERIVAGGSPNAHISGAMVEYDRSRPPGQRVTAVRLADGRPLDDGATYRVVMNDFMTEGGDGLGFGDAALSVESLGVPVLDVIIDYFKALPRPVRAPPEVRIAPVRP